LFSSEEWLTFVLEDTSDHRETLAGQERCEPYSWLTRHSTYCDKKKQTRKEGWNLLSTVIKGGLKNHKEDQVLAAPLTNEPIKLYLAKTNRVINVPMVVERKEEGNAHPVQLLVYYIGEILTKSKQRYPQNQKPIYRVFIASRKLMNYSQEHVITVVISTHLEILLAVKKLKSLFRVCIQPSYGYVCTLCFSSRII
jgi:hypothetical protein